jgi:hypothetical protein
MKASMWRGRYEGKREVGTLSGKASASNDLMVLAMARELQQWAKDQRQESLDTDCDGSSMASLNHYSQCYYCTLCAEM